MPIMFAICSDRMVRGTANKETAKERPDMTETKPTIENSKPQVGFDWRDWLPYLAEADMPEADKQASIEALWSIVIAFVDLGFEVKSHADTCGEAIDLKAALAAAVVSSEEDKNTKEDAA